MDTVVEFYNTYDEDTRLTLRHKTEFFVTTYFLDSIIKGGDYILDVAAGTGIYTLYYAQRGCTVEAQDIVPKHIEILNERISDLDIVASVGDARDLSLYPSGIFDIVLNMGAVYHLVENEIPACITESLRVLRTGGYLALAYINKYAGIENDNKYSDVFKSHLPAEIENYFENQDVSIIEHVPTDGDLFTTFEKYVDSESTIHDDTYKAFQQSLTNIEDYHYWFDENFTEQEIGDIKEKFIHALVIVKKNT